MKKVRLFLFAVSSCFIFSCGNQNDVKDVDVSDVVLPVEHLKIQRFEQDVFGMDTLNMAVSMKRLQGKYGSFYNSYVKGILNNGGNKNAPADVLMKRFIGDRDMKEVYGDCQKLYADISFLEREMEEMFKHYTYYFPDKKIPKVLTMMSGFNYPVIYTDSTLAIGLEMYLGSTSKFYGMLNYPKYKAIHMNKENIVTDVVRTWMFQEYPYNMNKKDFLSELIFAGKIMYLNDAMLPDVHDTTKIQYTQKQLDYCNKNEYNVWTYFIAQNLLYTTDYAEIMKFTSEGPFTTAFSKESPPRIAYWIGWQIVRQYMKNNPDITLEQLMQETDAQHILSKSKYKPKK